MKRIEKVFESEDIKVNEDEMSVTSYITTKDVDRDNEVILPEGVDMSRYEKNPVVLWSHHHDLPAIGRSAWRKVDEKGIISKTIFGTTPFAKEIFTLFKEKILKAFSVGFRPVKWEDGAKEGEPSRTFKEIELLEYSVCNVGCNPETLTLAYSKGLIKDKDTIKALKINKPEPEVTENYIRIRVEDPDKFVDDSFRTIDISAEQGIKAIIGKYKSDPNGPTHVQSYLFDKDKWTVAEAQAWVDEHRDSISIIFEDSLYQISIDGKHYGVNVPDYNDNKWLNYEEGFDGTKITEEKIEFYTTCQKCCNHFIYANEPEAGMGFILCPFCKTPINQDGIPISELNIIDDEIKGVIPYHEYPKAPEDEEWDAGAEIREAEVENLKEMCAWFDSEEPDVKGSYKLPHHKKNRYTTVWNGVRAAMGALLGARGGVDIPDADRKGVYNHLAKHYKEFDKEVPDFKEYTEEDEFELEISDNEIDVEPKQEIAEQELEISAQDIQKVISEISEKITSQVSESVGREIRRMLGDVI